MDPTSNDPVCENPAPALPEGRAALVPVAHLLHTLVLIAFLLVNSWLSARSPHLVTGAYGKIFLYLRNIGWECAAVAYVWWGVRRRTSLRELVGGRWRSAQEVIGDAALGAVAWLAIMLLLGVLAAALGMLKADSVERLHEARQRLGFLLPGSGVEVALFCVMSAAAGFCEEVVFRGYLQRQLAALTGNERVAIVAQALLFGAAHGYQGVRRMLLIAAEGVLLGVLALWRKSLRPGMVAHAMQDAITGMLARRLR